VHHSLILRIFSPCSHNVQLTLVSLLGAGIDSRLDDLVEVQLSVKSSQPGSSAHQKIYCQHQSTYIQSPGVMANTYALPTSPTAPLPDPWLSYPPGPNEQRPGFGPQAARPPRKTSHPLHLYHDTTETRSTDHKGHGFSLHKTRDFLEGRVSYFS
jgi:hypothetical protein